LPESVVPGDDGFQKAGGARVLSPVVRQLKDRTAPTHARVESGLALLDPGLSAARLRTVLARFAGFWPATERRVDEWAQAQPAAAAALDWPRRRRGDIIAADLRALGMTGSDLAAVPRAPAVFAAGGLAEAGVLGWLYVSEGSTLGGAVIDRVLRARAIDGVRTFTPYREGPGPMWRAYLDYLQHWVGDDDLRRAAVVDAAESSFAALEQWLAPIAVRIPA
jgi:heme oxygenase